MRRWWLVVLLTTLTLSPASAAQNTPPSGAAPKPKPPATAPPSTVPPAAKKEPAPPKAKPPTPAAPKAPPEKAPAPKPKAPAPPKEPEPTPAIVNEPEPEPGAKTAAESEPEPVTPPAPAQTPPARLPPPAPKPAPVPPPVAANPPTPIAQDRAATKAPAPIADLPPALSSRREELEAALDAAYKKKTSHPKELEALCRQWQPKKLFQADPTLEARLKLCAAEAAIAQGHLGDGEHRFSEALALAKAAMNPELSARIEMVRGDTYAAQLNAYTRCGTKLGLSGLTVFEADEEARLFKAAIRSYKMVAVGDDTVAAAQATAGIADVAAELYRRSVRPNGGYRGVNLPGRSTIAPAESSALPVELSGGGHWAREIDRLFAIALFRAKETKLDALADRIVKQRAAFRGLTPAPLEAITALDAPEGAMRFYRGQFEQRSAAHWAPMAPAAALNKLNEDTAAGFKTPTGPHSLRALAAGGKEVPPDAVSEALSDPKDPRFLAALDAVRAAPDAAFYPPLLVAWAKVRANARAPSKGHNDFTQRFSTLERALYGPEEQVLSALRAVVSKERPLALKASYDARLPLSERAYLLAELADNRAHYRLMELLRGADDTTVAIALYGIHKATGKRSVWTLKVYSRGVTGCVAEHLLDLEAARD